MGVTLRMAVGIMGNVASVLLYGAPILTFTRVIRKGSTEEFSCVPYVVALSNCLLYTWYGLPIVSHGLENFPVVTINGLGILLEFMFIFIYIWFASKPRKKVVLFMLLMVILVFCATTLVSIFVLRDHHHRKMFVGSVGLVASVSMYGSPLVALKQVMETKSVEFMPFYLSLFSFLASSLWMAFGLLGHDFFLASPNLVGCPMGLLQLVLYFKYRSSRVPEEVIKFDIEKHGTDLKIQKQQMIVDEKR